MRRFVSFALLVGAIGSVQAQEAVLDWQTPGMICLIDIQERNLGIFPPALDLWPGNHEWLPRCQSTALRLHPAVRDTESSRRNAFQPGARPGVESRL